MFYKLSKFFIYATAFAPLVLARSMFFPFIAGKAITFRILVELALLAFIMHMLAHANSREFWLKLAKKLKHPVALCIAVFALMVVFTALIGVNPTQSFWSNFERGEGAFQILHYAIFFLLTFVLFTDKKSFERLLIANIVASVPMCLYALMQLVTPIDSPSTFVVAAGDRVSGTLGNPSYLAAYLIFILTFLIYFFIKQKDVVWRSTIGLLGAFELYIFLRTGTRGAFLGLVAALLVFSVVYFFISKNRRLRTALAGSFVLILLLAGSFFATHQAPIWQHVPVLNRLINFNSAANDIKPRIWTWGSALSGFAERPIAGWGAENFPVPFDQFYNPNHYGIESFFDRTHNIFLEYAITGGCLVLLPWLAIFFFYYRRLRKHPRDLWYAVLFVVPIAYLIQGFFLFDTMPIYLAFFVFLAFVINTEETEISLEPHRGAELVGLNMITAGIATVAIGYLIYYTAFLPLQENAVLVNALLLQNTMTAQISAGQQPTITPNQVIDAFHEAINLKGPVGKEESIGMYQKFILSLIENLGQNEAALKDQKLIPQIRGLIDDTNKIYDENIAIYPGLKQQYLNGGINLRVGLTFRQADYMDRGKALFNEALVKAPTRLELIRVLIELAQIQKDQAALNLWGRRAAQLRPDLFKLEDLGLAS